ncbi:protein kinase superfamily protein [Artemisia annua]|uniref:Protein kinase superfamily protein n=1 Tax=Artemisia annua TaxID=35608 RepID=A0A2U1KAK4_ARTAN|nr:protein kinase superfamily protein [Artemisia annua]
MGSRGELRVDTKWIIDPTLVSIGDKIGEGSHTEVYWGIYKSLTVVVKVIKQDIGEHKVAQIKTRFLREVAMLSTLQHENVVKFIGASMEPMMVIITELLKGGTLKKHLANMKPSNLDGHIAIKFALDVARAMECLHSHGIIHRDLRPANLLLTEDHKIVKLVDFGLAREGSLDIMTAEIGAYRWMAPELYNMVTLKYGEKKHYNHKVDVYSFAMVLWELINNKLPFEGLTPMKAAYVADHKNERPSVDDLPRDLASLITSCWNEDPNVRPDFSKIIHMLERCVFVGLPPQSKLSHDSSGPSALVALTDRSTKETQETTTENKARGIFSCFYRC